MLGNAATIQLRIFCLPVSSLKFKELNVILSVVLYGYKTWGLALREERRLGCKLKGWWGKYMVLRERKWREAAGHSIMRGFISYTLRQVLLR